MRSFSGHDGSVFTLGDPFRFSLLLRDCGTGWDWVSPGVCCWDQGTVRFYVDMDEIEWADLWPRTGRVSFPRCLRGSTVRATGIGHTLSLVAHADWWKLNMEMVVADRSVLGSSDVHTLVKPINTTALVKTNGPITGPVFMVLPFTKAGVFTGCGVAHGHEIVFDNEGVVYEPA